MIDILYIIHFIFSAWGQVTRSTIQNCFVNCGHMKKNQKDQEWSDVTDVDGSGEDDVMEDEDWVRLVASIAGVEALKCLSSRRNRSSRCVVCREMEVNNGGAR
jgi:hypothetical protein